MSFTESTRKKKSKQEIVPENVSFAERQEAERVLAEALHQIRPFVNKDIYVPGMRKKVFTEIKIFDELLLLCEMFTVDVLHITILFLSNYYRKGKEKTAKITFTKAFKKIAEKHRKKVLKKLGSIGSETHSAIVNVIEMKCRKGVFHDNVKRLLMEMKNFVNISVLVEDAKRHTRLPYYAFFNYTLSITQKFFTPILVGIYGFISSFWVTKNNLDETHETKLMKVKKTRTKDMEDTLIICLSLFRLHVEESVYRPLGFLTKRTLTWSLSKISDIQENQIKVRKTLCSVIEMFIDWFFCTNTKLEIEELVFRWDHLEVARNDRIKCDHLIALIKSGEDIATVYAWAKVISNRLFLKGHISKQKIDSYEDSYNDPQSLFEGNLPWSIVSELRKEITLPGHMKGVFPKWVLLVNRFRAKWRVSHPIRKQKYFSKRPTRATSSFPSWVVTFVTKFRHRKMTLKRDKKKIDEEYNFWDFVPRQTVGSNP